MSFPMNVMNPYDANITSSMMDTTQPHGSLNLIVLVLLGMTVILLFSVYTIIETTALHITPQVC